MSFHVRDVLPAGACHGPKADGVFMRTMRLFQFLRAPRLFRAGREKGRH